MFLLLSPGVILNVDYTMKTYDTLTQAITALKNAGYNTTSICTPNGLNAPRFNSSSVRPNFMLMKSTGSKE
jgi:hypothetical protein